MIPEHVQHQKVHGCLACGTVHLLRRLQSERRSRLVGGAPSFAASDSRLRVRFALFAVNAEYPAS